jgi:hypothetical protein
VNTGIHQSIITVVRSKSTIGNDADLGKDSDGVAEAIAEIRRLLWVKITTQEYGEWLRLKALL